MKKKLFGWWSPYAENYIGSAIWITPFGMEVAVSIVSNSPTRHNTNWNGMIMMGEVLSFVKAGDEKRILFNKRAGIDYESKFQKGR